MDIFKAFLSPLTFNHGQHRLCTHFRLSFHPSYLTTVTVDCVHISGFPFAPHLELLLCLEMHQLYINERGKSTLNNIYFYSRRNQILVKISKYFKCSLSATVFSGIKLENKLKAQLLVLDVISTRFQVYQA